MSKRKRKRGRRSRGKDTPYDGVEGGMEWKPEPYPLSWVGGVVSAIAIFIIAFIDFIRKVKVHR